jgi:TetR/AcrR family transcriptional regulator, cholesterol catabolism regulator
MVETRRRQIENAASVLFRERGYPSTSVRDIARALDIQGASLYAHVASKEEMLWSIVDRAADRFDAEVAPIAAEAGLAPPERLSRMVRAHVRVVTTDQGSAIVFLDEWRYLSPARRASIAERRDAYEARFRAVISDGIAAGDFHAADPTLAAAFALSALNGISAWYRPDGRLTADQIADAYAAMILAALSKPPTDQGRRPKHARPRRIDE